MGVIIKARGVVLPAPTEIKCDNEIIWSSDTGRVLSGKMTGDVIAVKRTFSINWQFLTGTEMQLIESNLIAGFFSVSFFDNEINTEVYRGTMSVERLRGLGDGETWYRSASVSLIER